MHAGGSRVGRNRRFPIVIELLFVGGFVSKRQLAPCWLRFLLGSLVTSESEVWARRFGLWTWRGFGFHLASRPDGLHQIRTHI